MNVQHMSVIVMAGLAGSVMAADEQNRTEPTAGNVQHVGHIYFNVATGERITTVIGVEDVQSPASGEAGDEIWVIGGGPACSDFGSSTSYFFPVDSVQFTSGRELRESVVLDWGDIEADTVVDCVQIHWLTGHVDVDSNSDGIGDGVDGFGATWTFWDGMNGRNPQMDQIALPIVDLTLFGLPGNISDVPESMIAYYTADIDLAGSFGPSLVFEIGDTDSDLQEATLHNLRMDLRDEDGDGIPDIDPDEDGLADWGWSIDFHQPGTVDFDNADGDSDSQTGVDGDPLAFATAGITFGMAWPGYAEYDSVNDVWEWVLDGPTAGVTEDLFGYFDDLGYSGPVSFGGFGCDPYVPWADFAIVLYGPGGGSCDADLNFDSELDFLDISIFVSTFPDYNGDTMFDFLDISAFVNDFNAGCVF